MLHRVYKRTDGKLRKGLIDVRIREHFLRCNCIRLKKNRKYLLFAKKTNVESEPQLFIDKNTQALRWKNMFKRRLHSLSRRTKISRTCWFFVEKTTFQNVRGIFLWNFAVWFLSFSATFLNEGPFPLRAWKRAFFVSFIDLRLKRAQKKSIKQTKNALFHACSGNGPWLSTTKCFKWTAFSFFFTLLCVPICSCSTRTQRLKNIPSLFDFEGLLTVACNLSINAQEFFSTANFKIFDSILFWNNCYHRPLLWHKLKF